MNVSEIMTNLVLQIGIIVFAVRAGGKLVKLIGIPQVLGELLSGIAIGPYALGGIPFPGFPQGLFAAPVADSAFAVSPELYAFATVASIILLFASGLETDLGLFLRYSLRGGVIGIGGVVFSFVSGALVGSLLIGIPLVDPRCLFLGILSTATSVGITARILSGQKKMDSPEGVTILAAAVFDDVLGIILLAVILGIVSLITSGGGTLDTSSIMGIAGRALGIWLGFTALGLIFSKQLGKFLKIFKNTFDFSILALGIALLLAGIFEKQGLAMIIGAYTAGLSLSKTDIAAVIQERIHGIYEFFVPIFFAVMGMMVDVREIISPSVLIFGAVYTLAAVLAKVVGCGGPALLLGFNIKGALRIGTGMVPRGEVALIIAGIGFSAGILDKYLFGVVILMTLITTVVAPPLLNIALKIPGRGTNKPVTNEVSARAVWDFHSNEIADLVIDTLLKDLKNEGFYVQMMNIDDGLSQARKNNISLSIIEEENSVTIETSKAYMPFVKTAMYEVIMDLHDAIKQLKETSDPQAMKREMFEQEGTPDRDVLSLIDKDCIILDLKGNNKNEVLAELVGLLKEKQKIDDFELILQDVLQRESVMTTGMQHGIALPHAKSDGLKEIVVAIGIKKEGIDFDSADSKKSKIIILIISPRKKPGPHIQFLAAIGSLLQDESICEKVINAKTEIEVIRILQKR